MGFDFSKLAEQAKGALKKSFGNADPDLDIKFERLQSRHKDGKSRLVIPFNGEISIDLPGHSDDIVAVGVNSLLSGNSSEGSEASSEPSKSSKD